MAKGEAMIVDLQREHHQGCQSVITSLPQWFGYEGALAGVTKALETQQGKVAVDGGRVLGFVTTAPTFAETLEITYLAVHMDERHHGHGKALLGATCAIARERGASCLALLTLGPSGNSPWYEQTVAFYQAVGFWAVKEIHLSDWGGAPALLLVAPVETIA